MIIRRVEGLTREFKVTQRQAVIPNCLDKSMQPMINHVRFVRLFCFSTSVSLKNSSIIAPRTERTERTRVFNNSNLRLYSGLRGVRVPPSSTTKSITPA